MTDPKKIIPIAPATPEEDEEYTTLFAAEKKIYPRSVEGFFSSLRWLLVWLTQLFFYGVPWLQWDSRQAMLFDLSTQHFYIFGLVLYPQDLSLIHI